MNSFSERQGLTVPDAEIAVRQEAPAWLRDFVISVAYEVGFTPSDLRTILCRQLLESPNLNNWPKSPGIDREVHDLIEEAAWFHVYDLIETLFANRVARNPQVAEEFAQKINQALRRKGVGWQLVDGQIQVRGPEIFEQSIRSAAELAEQSGRLSARGELQESLRDLSRRPDPELTGAIQHAMAALECVARDVTGDPKLTLGDWLKKNPKAFPAPLTSAVEKLWGYTSEYGRHVREGRPTTFEEAELVVGISGALAVYLLRKT
jgi:hypothetical protein